MTEGQAHLDFREVGRRRIVDTPMRSDRFAGPARRNLTPCVVANSEDEIEGPCSRGSELDPAFASQTVSRELHVCKKFEGERMNLALWTAAGAISAELVRAPVVDERLAHDAAAGITGADK